MSGPDSAPARDGNSSVARTTTLPPLTAAFLIKFDPKVGYSITWRQSLPDVVIDGVVEYKSLPSGLHNVKEDLVYFVHDRYAGVSAFANGPAAESERNAHLVSMGVLVPLSQGRMGRCWLHAQRLRELASQLVLDINDIEVLEEFWDKYRLASTEQEYDSSLAVPSPLLTRTKSFDLPPLSSQNKHEAPTDLTLASSSPLSLPSTHPARSLLDYVQAFGPLIFPLYRAAVLRKRILFVTTAPVRRVCDYVYILSVLSSIPNSVSDDIPSTSEHLCRLRPLFAVGVHDISFLEKEGLAPPQNGAQEEHCSEDAIPAKPSLGWIACTTDEILATKKKLYDIMVEMPASAPMAQGRRWPKVRTAEGMDIKASQRDLRRYKALESGLKRMNSDVQDSVLTYDEDDDDTAALLPSETGLDRANNESHENSAADIDELVEPMSWTALAYSSFMWWASAGERDSSLREEARQDNDLLGDTLRPEPATTRSDTRRENGKLLPNRTSSGDLALQFAVIEYFHRLTALTFSSVASVVDSLTPDYRSADEDGDGGDLVLSSEYLACMGLDEWNDADRAFVRDLIHLYFGLQAELRVPSVECCGVKIC